MYIVGGVGYDQDGLVGELSDVWTFDMSSDSFIGYTGTLLRNQDANFSEGSRSIGESILLAWSNPLL